MENKCFESTDKYEKEITRWDIRC